MTQKNELNPRTTTAEVVDNGSGDVERTTTRRVYTPATDIVESSDEYMLQVDVPGADPASLDVTYENDVLTIRASTKAPEHADYTLAHAEFELGDYQRAFSITEKIDADRIEAGFQHGVLTIRLPKQKPARRRIAISAS